MNPSRPKQSPPTQPEAGAQALHARAAALGLSADWLKQLLDKVGPLLAQVLIAILEQFAHGGGALVQGAMPGALPAACTPQEHARCCDRCLEHILAAAAICIHHRQCCDAPPGV